MPRSALLALAALVAALASGCASSGDVVADENRTDRRAVPQPESVALEPESETPRGDSLTGELLERDAQEIRDRGRDPEPTPESDPAPLSIRDDGRPSWWFSGPRLSDAEISVCAEALGPDMRLTREAAIDAGRTRLRLGLELPASEALPDAKVVRVWVWPLPNAQAGSNRYAGYVLMSAPLRQ